LKEEARRAAAVAVGCRRAMGGGHLRKLAPGSGVQVTGNATAREGLQGTVQYSLGHIGGAARICAQLIAQRPAHGAGIPQHPGVNLQK